MQLFCKKGSPSAACAGMSLQTPVARRTSASARLWMKVIVLVLFLPVWWWLVTVLPPPFSVIEFATHIAEEGEHCDDFCAYPVTLIDHSWTPAPFAIPDNGLASHELLITVLPPPHLARDHPPSLFYSLCHSLRAPPTLIPA